MWKHQVWADTLRLPCLDLQESIKLLKDLSPPRIPIPFQSKHLQALKRNVWFALKRPQDRSKTGYLCILPSLGATVFVSGEQPSKRFPERRVALINCKVDPQFVSGGPASSGLGLQGPTVMEATLSARDRRLTIEDVCQWKGKIVNGEPFQNRFTLAKQWLEHYCIPGPEVQMELAQWLPLTSVRPDGVWELMDHVGRNRLRWISKRPEQVEVKVSGQTQGMKAIKAPENNAVPVSQNLVALATKSIGPDQWDLTTSDGASLGRGLIRSMAVSSMLRGITQPTKVEVRWTPSFKKWEILGLSQGVLNPRENFDAQKVEDGV
jgi:hypothetical protein